MFVSKDHSSFLSPPSGTSIVTIAVALVATSGAPSSSEVRSGALLSHCATEQQEPGLRSTLTSTLHCSVQKLRLKPQLFFVFFSSLRFMSFTLVLSKCIMEDIDIKFKRSRDCSFHAAFYLHLLCLSGIWIQYCECDIYSDTKIMTAESRLSTAVIYYFWSDHNLFFKDLERGSV